MARFSFNLDVISQTVTAPLVIVIPIYNEEKNIATVISAWTEKLESLGITGQILAIDDGSRDGTHEILLELEEKSPDMICVVHKPNSGHGPSCRIGYEIASRSQSEWVLQIDSDGQCDPVHFDDFWKARDRYDCIFGIRTSRDDGLARVMTSAICRLGASIICGEDLRDPNVPYRLMRRSALAMALPYIPSSFNVHNVALTYVLKKIGGMRWNHVPIHFRDRQGGTNSINVLQVVTLGAEMLLELLRIKVRPRPNRA